MGRFYLALLLFFMCSSCKSNSDVVNSKNVLTNYLEVKVVDARGLAGCGFLLEDKNSVRYQPVNLADSLTLDGKKIFILFVDEKNKMTTCMGGRLIRITDVKVLKK